MKTHLIGAKPWVGITVSMAAVLVTATFPGSVARANHESRTLEVTPEATPLEAGSTHLMTATLSAPANVTSGTINIDFENQSGANDNDGTSYVTPDLTCSIPAGESACSVSYSGEVAGVDLWRAWIDHDGRDSTVEADIKEGRDEVDQPGDGGPGPCSTRRQEPDCTDVVRVRWVSGGGAALDCDDSRGLDREEEVRPAGGGSTSNETYVCTVTDESGNPTNDADPVAPGIQPIVINAEIENGVNDPDAIDGASYESPDYTCTAGEPAGTATGTCQITVTQNENEAGTAAICFWVGDAAAGQSLCSDELVSENQAADGSDQGNDLADRVTLSWQERAASGVDAERETAKNPLEQEHTVTISVYDQFGEPFVGNTVVNGEFFKGSPSDTDGNDPSTPDLTCATNNSSSCTITFTQTTIPGTDLLCLWTGSAPQVTLTNNNGACGVETLTDEDDEAGSADAPQPRTDNIDVVQKIWQSPTDAVVIDCKPERQTQTKGKTATITCVAKDAAGAPVAGAEIDAEITGANDPDGANLPAPPDLSCVTGVGGACTLLHGSNGVGRTSSNGTTLYRAWLDADNDNSTTEADQNEQLGDIAPNNTDVVERRWTTPSGGCSLMGTSGSDRLIGTGGRDIICGLGGDDSIEGLGGRDGVLGGRGADTILGGPGDDTLNGGRGKDDISGGKGDDRLFGGPGSDRCRGGAGRDSVSGCER
ncbi:MAG: calcium-binding protein [Actinomycetota bacterium]